jgi:RHS repeat-associated protein
MVLEDRRLLTTNLSPVSAISTYAGVGFQENAVAGLIGYFANGQLDLNPSDYQVQVNWGDGGSQWTPADLASANPSPGFLVKGSHIYAAANHYDIQVRATGPDGMTVTQTTCSANVSQMPSGIAGTPPNATTSSLPPSNVRLNLSPVSSISSFVGVGFQENVTAGLNGSLNGQLDPKISDYQAQINWGDSDQWLTADLASANPSPGFLVKGSHIYTQAGNYHVVVYAQGPDGTSISSETTSAIVRQMPNGIAGIPPDATSSSLPPSNVQLNLSPVSSISAIAGVTTGMQRVAGLSGSLNGKLDAKAADYQAQINWGDSSAWDQAEVVPDPNNGNELRVEGAHTYYVQGLYHVVVYAQGPDGTSISSETTSVDVAASPNPTQTPPPLPTSQPFCDLTLGPLQESASVSDESMGVAGAVDDFSVAPVRYADGTVALSSIDLTSGGFGASWTQSRSWSNTAGYAALDANGNPVGANGNGWVDSQLPFLLSDNSGNTAIVVLSGTNALFFDNVNSNPTPRFFVQDQLRHANGEFIVTDTVGDQIHFYDFSQGRIGQSRSGRFKSMTDPYGNTSIVTSWTADGNPAETVRSTPAGVNPPATESWLYSYVSSGVNQGLLANVSLRRLGTNGTWTIVRQVHYAYYNTGEANGNPGDLKTAVIEDGAGNVLDTSYYRYYPSYGGFDGLKYVFNPQSFARLSAVVANPFTASDQQAAPYADNYFEYDAERRVSKEVAQGTTCDCSNTGGQGTFTFSYFMNFNNPDAPNSWTYRTIEILPDSRPTFVSQNIIYCNSYGEVLLKVYESGTPGNTQKWDTFYQYDAEGRLILQANPSAVTGYDESTPDLLKNVAGHYQYLQDNQGEITRIDYYAATTATETTPGGAAGYYEDTTLQQGQLGTPIVLNSTQYFAHSGGGATVYPQATTTVYRNPDGTGAETTQYADTWYPGTVRMESQTVTQPVVSADQNGPGVADTQTTVYDIYGRSIWQQDGNGFLTYTAYDQGTGAVIERITDVDTSRTGEFQGLPAGWTTPTGGGLNLVTAYEVDGLGRTTALTDPNGNVTYTVYDDPDQEMRTYVGWQASTDLPTGPTLVTREDRTHSPSYTETLTLSAPPHVTNGRPDGTEPISDVQTLSRTFTSPGGQVLETDKYFSLDGITYSSDPYLGSAGTNYYATLYGYDHQGRLNRTLSPTGTITRTVYDGLGRVVSTWLGTNDTPASGYWSPDNNTAPSNLVEISARVYDNGGVGDGNLTQETDFPGGGAAPRVTQYFYDWRDRLVASRQGVQDTENDGTNRPIRYTTYDNLNEVVLVQQYEGDGVSLRMVQGVPQSPDPSLLRAQTAYAYDDQGRLYQKLVYAVDPATGAVSSAALATNYYYDHRGDQMAESVPGGLWTKDVYDGAGRLVVAYTTDGGGGNSWAGASGVTNDIVLEQTESVYDEDGNAIETINRQRFHNATGTGALGDPSSTTAPQARVSYTGSYYDAANRLTARVNVGTNGGTAWVLPATVPARSDLALVTSYTYNVAGWVEDTVDPRGIDMHTAYDALGRTTETIANYTGNPETNNSDVTTEYTYDGDNHVLTLTAVQPAGTPSQTTEYVYGVTPANGSALASNDLLAAMLYPDPATGQPSNNQAVTYTYDALGQVSSMTDRNGTTHQYSYDVLGRQTSDAVTALGAGVNGSVLRLDTAYDQQGNPYLFTSYADPAGTMIVNQVADVYNGLGQLTAEYQSHAGPVQIGATPQVQYTYNEMANGENNSRLTTMIDPDGRVIEYNYDPGLDDSISRLGSISDASGVLEAYLYLGLDAVVERDHPQTGVDLTYISPTGAIGDAGDPYTGLDRFGRVVEQLWLNRNTGTVTDDFQYSYDAGGNVLSKNNLLSSAFNEQYSYDGLNQLTNFVRGTETEGWGLDALGNWTNVTTNGAAETRTANAQNQYTSLSGGSTLSYDNNGNLTTDPTNGNTYIYDAWNRLMAVESGGAAVASYSYDALGRRTTETSTATLDLYFSKDWQVVEEQAGGGTQTQYVWSPVYVDAMVERDTSDGTRLYVQQDADWNVTTVVDVTGTVQERYVYEPYGAVTFLAPDGSSRTGSAVDWIYLHEGGRLDTASGLYNFRQRDYAPALGRWLEQDPIGFRGGQANLYAYVGNDPVNRADPLGLCAIWIGYNYVPQAEGYPVNAYHSFLVTGDIVNNVITNQTEFRAGPTNQTEPYGNLIGTVVPPGQSMDVHNDTIFVQIVNDNKPCKCYNDKFADILDRVNTHNIPYDVLFMNSNTVTARLLESIGKGPLQPPPAPNRYIHLGPITIPIPPSVPGAGGSLPIGF